VSFADDASGRRPARRRSNMEAPLENSTEEIRRLQRCISDLVSVLALPAMWTGAEPTQIVSTLLDTLLGMLRLDLVYVRLKDPVEEAPIEMVRVAESRKLAGPQEIGEAMNKWLGDDPQRWPSRARDVIGGTELSIAAWRLGLQGEIGVIVAGSERADFPRQTEGLLLSVAANQASIALKEARLLSEQKRIASELDRRVAQRTAELAAANDELQLRVSMLQQIPVAAWSVEPDGTPDIVNHRWLEYTGQTLDYVRSTPEAWMATLHPEDRERAATVYWDGIRSGQGFTMEARFRRAQDGTYRWHLNRAVALRDAAGKIARFVATSTDIEDQKQSQRSLTSIINAMPTLLASASPNGWGDFFNQRWLDYTGLTAEQLQGWGWATPLHPDDVELLKIWRSSLVSGAPLEAEARMRRFDGVYRWFVFRGNPLRDESGRIVKWYGTSIDIDDRKCAERELQRKEAFLAEAQRLSMTGSFTWCLDTDEIAFSEQLYRIFEFEQNSPVTVAQIGTRVHPDDIPLLTERLELARNGVNDLNYEIRLRMPDGRIKYVRTDAYGSRDPDGRLEYLGAVQDVTERRLSEEALGRLRSELAHMTRVMTMGQLTASIAHEVNQPLSGIITNASTCLRMLAADPPNIDGALETTRRTIRDGNRASEVITRLRALYSKKEGSPESMDLNEATQEVIILSLSELQKNRIILRPEFTEELPQVTGDRVQLQQVIMNLLRNASDAMSGVDDRPRELTIRTEREEGDRVRLTVRDAGAGFDPRAMDRLFEAFYTTKNDGMGMGLSVSRSIIESHQGRLWATLNDGPGATFSFSIPCASKGATGARSLGAN
jgi:PAS domain S-box-containing protein